MNKIFKHKQILFQIVSIRTLCRHLIPYKFYISYQLTHDIASGFGFWKYGSVILR